MEDYHGIRTLKQEAVVANLYAIFDGHGGSKCARSMSTALPLAVLDALAGAPDDVENALGTILWNVPYCAMRSR